MVSFLYGNKMTIYWDNNNKAPEYTYNQESENEFLSHWIHHHE